MTIELHEEEFQTLTLMCGYATGAAMASKEFETAKTFLRLTNRLHENRTDYTPYDVESLTRTIPKPSSTT